MPPLTQKLDTPDIDALYFLQILCYNELVPSERMCYSSQQTRLLTDAAHRLNTVC